MTVIKADPNFDSAIFNRKLFSFAKKHGIDMSRSTTAEGDAFELFVATVFRFNGYVIDSITGGSGDRGADFIAHKGSKTIKKVEIAPFVTESRLIDTRVRYCVQCKFHLSGKEGLQAAVQAAHGKRDKGCNKAIAVSSTDFNSEGMRAANVEKVETINGAQLSTLIITASKKQNPWMYKWSREELIRVGFTRYL